MIAAAIPDYGERTFYTSGPPDMVRATEQASASPGCPPGPDQDRLLPRPGVTTRQLVAVDGAHRVGGETTRGSSVRTL